MKQQTAVEWLYERLERMIPRTSLYNIDKKEYFEQAKEMEKQQIIDANNRGYEVRKLKINETAQDYYNEKYKKS